MSHYYSPIWFDVSVPGKRKPRKVTSVKFEMGERVKYCKKCDDWHPADTEFFNEARSRKLGLSPWCRACNSDNQNDKRYWEK